MSSVPVSAEARPEPAVRPGTLGWERALRTHPELGPLSDRVAGLSGTLARRFREAVLRRQAFARADAEMVARECIADYLAERLRDDPQSRRFAGLLAQADHHAALADFVGAIKVLGPPAFAQVSESVLRRHRLVPDGEAIGSVMPPFSPPAHAPLEIQAPAASPREQAPPGTLLRRAEVARAETLALAPAPRPGHRVARFARGPAPGITGTRALGHDEARAASPFARIAAWLIDWATWFGPAAIAVLGRPGGVPIDAIEAQHVGGITLLSVLALLMLQTWLLAVRGQSIGKLVLGLRIVRTDTDEPPGLLRGVVLRGWLTHLVYGVPMIGLLVFAIDALLLLRPDRRTLHDIVADTQVIRA